MNSLASLLRDNADAIVGAFVAEIQRKDLSPPGVGRSLLIDHIPRFLEDIVNELTASEALRASQDAVDTSTTAREHGSQRWNLGYDLEALIREYGVLRHIIFQAIKDNGIAVSVDAFDILSKCLNVGVVEAAAEYVKYRDEQLKAQRDNLQFLADAGQLLASSLDYRATLGRLTGLVVPQLADWCAVHLQGAGARDMPLAHVDPTKANLVRTLVEHFPLPVDSPYGYPSVERSGEPQLMRSVDPALFKTMAQSDEHLSLLRQLNTCSWITVPLQVQENVFGAITLAFSDSGRHYDSSNLVVATELARRAAIAIDNARLYDLSQKERSRVEAATRAKDEFVAMVTHELRTPLNAILGWLRLLRIGSLDDSKKEHALNVIERNAEAQSRLVADLLDISRSITGKIRITSSQVDMSNVVDMAIEGMRPAAEAKRIKIDVDLDRDQAILRGDGDRLQQVVLNLLANAIKFTPKDGAVRVRVRRIDSDIELVVEDTGQGIAADFLPHVFEIFRQSDASITRAHGGLGIGLSIAKHIVELHGGSIEARSAGKGAGATFTVRLPISPLVSTTLGVPRVPATKPGASITLPAGLEQTRVLLVDDDEDARALVTVVLESCGVVVRAASSVREAMAELQTFTPHVIISDIGMPDEDGYSLIRNIRTLADEEKKSIPAIALTAFSGNEARARALVAGFNIHLAKPVAPAVLVRAVLDVMGNGHR
jgi:signal transduction histidine kinase/ActR/RegA family two-component response regulator